MKWNENVRLFEWFGCELMDLEALVNIIARTFMLRMDCHGKPFYFFPFVFKEHLVYDHH